MKLYIPIIFVIFGVCGKCLGIEKNIRYAAAQKVLDIIRDPERYDKDLMPYSNDAGPLQVKISMHILSLDIDDFNMRTNVDLYFRMHWNDPRLAYKAEVNSVKFADTSEFYIPDAFFRNSFKTEMMESIFPESMIRIKGNGDIIYSARFNLNLKCSMNLKKFPHDQQSCPLYIESYGYSMEDLVFTFKSESEITLAKNMVTSKRFTVDSVNSDYCTAKAVTGNYSCVYLLFGINRIFNIYLLEWYLPIMSLVITAFLSELLDPTLILPRLLITVGPLLTLAATSLSYHQTLPSVPYVTAMDVFCGVSLLVIFIIVLHILISFYYSSQPCSEPKTDEEEKSSRWKSICQNIKNKVNNLAKLIIIGSYVLFLIAYFIAYNV